MRGLRLGLMSWVAPLCAVALLAVLLAGCAPAWPFPQPTPDSKLPDAEQIFRPLKIGPNSGVPQTLDPAFIAFAQDYDWAQLIFPALVTLDDHQQVVDWAAERHEVSPDGLIYTFHLHSNMVWSDGTPITAETFAYAINRSLDPCTGTYAADYLFLIRGAETFNKGLCPSELLASPSPLIGTSITVPDPLTLRLTLERPAGYFLSALTFPTSWAAPRDLIERYAQPVYSSYGDVKIKTTVSTWTDHLLDAGPFGGNLYRLVDRPAPNSAKGALIFERNERFWGKRPTLRRLEYTLYSDTNVLWRDFKAGTGDAGYPVAADLPAARALKGVVLHETPQLVYDFLTLNWTLAPMNDQRMRQAFSLALDRKAIAHDVLQDLSLPTIHLVPEGVPGYNPTLADAAGRVGAAALTPDLATARALASAYAAEKCDGSLSKCPVVLLVYEANRPTTAKLIDTVVAQWAVAFPGLTIHAFPRPDGPSRPLGWYCCTPIQRGSWGDDYPDPQDFLSLLWTTNAPMNKIHVGDSETDRILAQADALPDLAARLPLYQQAEQRLVTAGVAIPLYQPLQTYVVRSRVVGWTIAPTLLTPLPVWQTAYLTK